MDNKPIVYRDRRTALITESIAELLVVRITAFVADFFAVHIIAFIAIYLPLFFRIKIPKVYLDHARPLRGPVFGPGVPPAGYPAAKTVPAAPENEPNGARYASTA